MRPREIKQWCVYDYLPARAQQPWPCVLVTEIRNGRVYWIALEEEGDGGDTSLRVFAARTKSRRHKRTWEPIKP